MGEHRQATRRERAAVSRDLSTPRSGGPTQMSRRAGPSQTPMVVRTLFAGTAR